jgi:hypothetical protein
MMIYIGSHIENSIQLSEDDWPPVPGGKVSNMKLMQNSYLAIKFSGDEVEVIKDCCKITNESTVANTLTDKHKTMLMLGLIPKHIKSEYIDKYKITYNKLL